MYQQPGREPPPCSFCGLGRPRVRTLIVGPPPSVICDGCVEVASRVIATGRPGATRLSAVVAVGADVMTKECGFCGKGRPQVAGLAQAGAATICSECADLCQEIISAAPGP